MNTLFQIWFGVALVIVALSAIGCASVRTDQTKTVAPDGTEVTRTRFRANTFFDSKNELAKARTTMTDKSQGVAISGLEQESSASNVVSLAESVVRGAVEGAVKGAKAVP